jgi:NitT/TauT family transport system substrate-binding protein
MRIVSRLLPGHPGRLARVIVLAGLLIAAHAPLARAQTYHLVQAGFRVLYLAPVFVAMDHGFFKDHGVELTFKEIDSGALAAAAIMSNSAQISDLDIKGIAEMRAQGKATVLFYNLVDRVTLDMIVRKDVLAKSGVDMKAPVLERLKALKGLTIGMTRPGAPTDLYARYLLTLAHLDPDRDATIVQVGGVPALESAFRSGRISAFMLSPPLPQKLEHDGVGDILVRNTAGELPALDHFSYVALFTSADYAKSNGPALTAYSHAIQDAVEWIDEHPDDAVKLLAAKWFKDASPEDLAISLKATMPSVSATGLLSVDELQRQLAVSEALGEKPAADLTEGVLWTNAFVK